MDSQHVKNTLAELIDSVGYPAILEALSELSNASGDYIRSFYHDEVEASKFHALSDALYLLKARLNQFPEVELSIGLTRVMASFEPTCDICGNPALSGMSVCSEHHLD